MVAGSAPLYPVAMSSAAPLRLSTAADLLAIPERERFHEVIDGEIVRKAMPSMRHGTVQVELSGELAGAYGLRSRGRGPGGWIFASETEIQLEPSQVFRPDVAGWRREALPKLPDEVPITQRPEWICEILSPPSPQNDLIKKMRVYQRCQIAHYWILDPVAETLSVYRWTLEGYLLIQTAEGRERIRAEPFSAVELSMHGLLEADPDE
jgi:Uma2 family endonuclease